MAAEVFLAGCHHATERAENLRDPEPQMAINVERTDDSSPTCQPVENNT